MPSIASRLWDKLITTSGAQPPKATTFPPPSSTTNSQISTTLRCPMPNLATPSPDNLRQYYNNGVVPQYRIISPGSLNSASAGSAGPSGVPGTNGSTGATGPAGPPGTGDVDGPASAVDSDFVQFDGTTGKLIKDGGLSLTTDGTLAADLDTLIPSEKAVKTYVDNATAAPTGTANKVYATPNGAPGAASLRVLVMADLPASLQIAPIGVTLFASDVGKPQYINVPANCTIVSWTLIADAVGAASVDVWFKAGAAPPTAPPIPLVADKISAAAPIVLAAAQSSAGGAAAISTWTNPLTQWGMLAFNPTAMSGCTKAMIQLQLQRA